MVIYNDNSGSPGTIAHDPNIYYSYLRGPVSSSTPITIPVNWNATPGTYWLEVKTNTTGYLRRYDCGVTFPETDNTGQNLLSITGTRQWSNPSTNFGMAYNWKISRGEPYPCGRVPVTITTENCPAPVNFADFRAILSGGKTYLIWITAKEENNNFFSIERSYDGIHYETIGFVKGAGTSDLVNTYSFTDLKPLSGISYYRIRQEDFDGSFAYSQTRTISNSTSVITVYPNPFENSFKVLVQSDSPECYITVTDITGRVVHEASVSTNKENIIGGDFSPGLYIIKIHTNEHSEIVKVEKLK